jgi:hypothetical protein
VALDAAVSREQCLSGGKSFIEFRYAFRLFEKELIELTNVAQKMNTQAAGGGKS